MYANVNYLAILNQRHFKHASQQLELQMKQLHAESDSLYLIFLAARKVLLISTIFSKAPSHSTS